MPARPTEDDIVSFVTNSTAIAGEKYIPDSPSGMRHYGAAKNLATPHRFVAAEIINAELQGITSGWLRTGVAPGQRVSHPHPDHIKQLLAEWNLWVESALDACAQLDEQARERFCWEAHDKLMCIRAFQERNGRTARLLLNLIRGVLDLSWKSILYEDTKGYYARLDEYRDKVFLPWYEEWKKQNQKQAAA